MSDLQNELSAVGLRAELLEPDPKCLASVLETDMAGEVLLFTDLCVLLHQGGGEDYLRRMRPLMNDARARGWRILMISTVPQDLYPTLSGSSIIIDATCLQGRPLTEAVATDFVASLGVSANNEASRRIVERAAGNRALLEIYTKVELSLVSGNEKKRLVESREYDIALQTFAEIGPLLCSSLEYWIFEMCQRQIDENDISPHFLVALRSAGVIALAADDERFDLLPFANQEIWRRALGDYLESIENPPETWLVLVAELFRFERRLRRDIRLGFGTSFEFESALMGYEGRIIELARKDLYPAASKLSDIRSPLDWLTLSELIAVASAESGRRKGRFLGYLQSDWVGLERDLVTVRNRVAHMRLTRQGDLATVRRCRQRYERTATRVLAKGV